MAIEKNSFKVSRLESDFSSRSLSSDEEEFQRQCFVIECDDDDEFDDCDSGAGSDDFDLLELRENGEEFCEVGDQTCSIPFELYDLPGLGDILSMDVWNNCLTEEERFTLVKYLPDMDQETFMRSLKELFTGCNFHFGSPVNNLFDMLKGGLCEPRVALYRHGLNLFQKRQHYYLLWKHQNSMVTNLFQIRNAWFNCRGYSIEEKLRVLNIMKSQKNLMYDKMEELETDSSEREASGDGLWSKRLKDWKLGHKVGRYLGYSASPTLDFHSQGSQMALEPAKYGKLNPKGTLKLARSKMSTKKELAGSVHHGLEMKSEPYGSALGLHSQSNAAGYNAGAAVQMRDQVRGEYFAEEALYEVAVHSDRNFSQTGAVDKHGAFKVGKKYEGLRGEEYSDSFLGLPTSLTNDLHAFGRNRTVNQLSDIKVLTAKPSNGRLAYYYGKKLEYPENIQEFAVDGQIEYGMVRSSNLPLKGNQIELSDGAAPFWHSKTQGKPFSVDPSFKYGDWNVKSQKRKTGRNSPDLKVNDRLFHSEYRAKPQEKVISMQNVGQDMKAVKGIRMFTKGEETESDSSEQIGEDEDDNPLTRSKWAYSTGVSDVKSGPDPKKAKFVKKVKKSIQRSSHSSKKMGDLDECLYLVEGENYSLKEKLKGKMHDIGHLNNSNPKGLDDIYFSGPVRLNGDYDQDEIYKLGRNGQVQWEQGERFHMPSLKSWQKGEVGRDYSVPQTTDLHDYIVEKEDESHGTHQSARDNGVTGRLEKKGQISKAYADDRCERSDVQLLGCNSVTKKWKLKDDVTCMDDRDDKDYLVSNAQLQPDDTTFLKKWGKGKLEDDTGSFEKGASEPPVTEMAAEAVDIESKPLKKPFILITPTVHTSFSFSIIHLLSAVRMAMITLLTEDSLEIGKHHDRNDGRQKLKEEQDRKQESNWVHLNGNLDIDNSEQSEQANVPSLTVQEIVNRVRSNPGDPCILETQEPLQDLVRGVLKIFSSKTAPLGAKGWKALVSYEKSTKSWSWICPVPQSSSDHEAIEEVTSPEAWGLPHKMLVKLVDSFANWLKSGQETLQQIGSLPAPPLIMMQLNSDEKERFRDLKAQKSLNTISPSSDEVRSYFQKEEVLRYSIPDRAFCYTSVDGRKSIVAPLRRCGGKPTSKARDHFMLKRNRPPHVTILCLVRDAAARLPGSIGTRADVCTLIRDSQYIVEDVSDAQVNQVVSGALDRLHYERDPCVQFDGERKLWVYLHREREEEDFEDDGTSSTKKWKRQKKEAAEPSDQGTVTVAYHGNGEQTGFDLSSDLNVEPSCADDDKRIDLMHYDGRHQVEDNIATAHGSKQGAVHQGPPMFWETLGLNPIRENMLLCQENSTNEDFNDETFGSERPAELLSTGLL